jgi:quercetin dioxygenase-like cupin family protein
MNSQRLQIRTIYIFRRLRGCGRVQREGGPIEEIRPGDSVWFDADAKHWNGASPESVFANKAVKANPEWQTVDQSPSVTGQQRLEVVQVFKYRMD